MNYRPEVDGLRAIAVLPVILFHAGFSWFSGGFVGVDVFFVISGYLITSIIYQKVEVGRFSFAEFYERRFRRILPALVFMLIVCVPFAWAIMTPDEYKNFSQNLLAVSFMVSNLHLWKEDNYFAPASEENPLLHTWSLSVEEQFYVVFPLILLFTYKLGKRYVALSVFLLFVVSLGLMEFVRSDDPKGAFYFLHTRAWELCLGALCALVNVRAWVSRSQTLPLLGLALIAYSIFAFDENTPFPSAYTLLPTIGAALFLVFGDKETISGKLLSGRVLTGIGLISYSVYLWHQPVFAFSRIAGSSYPTWVAMLGLSVLSIFLGYISWRFVELPFRKIGGQKVYSRKGIFRLGAFSTLIVVAFGVHGNVTKGAPSRITLTDEQESYLNTAIPSPMRERCHASSGRLLTPNDSCIYNEGASKSIAVFGDSHAVELAYSLGKAVKKLDTQVYHFSFSACRPVLGGDASDPCSAWSRDILEFLVNSDHITHVVISYRLAAILKGDHKSAYPKLPNEYTDSYRAEVISDLHGVFQTLLDSGKKVIFVEQAPELPDDMKDLVYGKASDESYIVGVPYQWWEKRTVDVYDERLNVSRFEILKTDSLFCESKACYAGRDGTSYYFDDDHMSIKGADVVVREILDLDSLENIVGEQSPSSF